METILLSDSPEHLEIAAGFIRNGEVVGIPTETVYGLGADATNEDAVKKIFEAKGRPADNPLIVHLCDFSDAEDFTSYIPKLAYKLAERFCPGPFTMVLPKNNNIPYVTSGGLETVGIRIPVHPVIRKIIKQSGKPIAAPSANISGYPSPTEAVHVMNDMKGKIAAVIDGGRSEFGVESTVIAIENENTVRILRPGSVTREDMLEVCPNVIIDKAILSEIGQNEAVPSPGMKYKHYSPNADITIIDSSLENFIAYVEEHNGKNVFSLIFDADKSVFPYSCLTYGDKSDEQAHNIFNKLRELDALGAEKVYVRAPSCDGVGLAVYNRLIRAAGFEVIRI